MNSSQIRKIIKLNNDFYKLNAEEFSYSRLYPWKGWNKLIPLLNTLDKNPLTILDLGCGNGRFLDFLNKNTQLTHFTYHGIDNSNYLLKIANEKFKMKNEKLKEFQFVNTDIFNIKSFSKNKYDLVVAFGITHHIPGVEYRENWFKSVSNLVNKNGYLVLSFWNPDRSKLLPEKLDGFEENDYLVSWNKNNSRRYVHVYCTRELTNVINSLIKNGYKKVTNYIDDVKKDSHNNYYIFEKIK